jgi:phospholipase/carboxylesterase
LRNGVISAAMLVLAACVGAEPDASAPSGEIAARAPVLAPDMASLERGLQRINAYSIAYIPGSYSPDRPAPFILLLHGARGRADNMIRRFEAEAEKRGVILLAVDSEGRTWDVMVALAESPNRMPSYGGDPARIDAALKETFARYAVDPAKVAVSGFSDGAGYAVSLGAENAPLFRHVMAFSAGVLMPFFAEGKTRVFISHGTKDRIIPVDSPRLNIVPVLRNAGFEVEWREFDGGHEIPPAIMSEAFDWFLE